LVTELRRLPSAVSRLPFQLMTNKKLLVIGGGASGFFCAINAARMNPDLEIIIVEKTSKLLSKVKVSGGGRCNLTHACFDIEEMSKQYPRGSNFIRKTFHQFFTTDTIQWFEEKGVKLKTENDGRMFPVTDSSQTIIDCLMKEVNKYGIEIRLNTEVKDIVSHDSCLTPHDSTFKIQTDRENIECDFICIACGGYPKSFMFDWLRKLGHSIQDPVPSLFTFNMPGNPIVKLMGVSVDKARIKIIGTKLQQEAPLLITHWGLSGPVVLRLSAWGARELATCNWQFAILVNWIPDYNEQSLKEKFLQLRFELGSKKMRSKNSFDLPQRLWEFLLEQSEVDAGSRWSDLRAKDQTRLIKNLCAWESLVKGKTTFKEEFVTAGGVQLNEVDANSMMSKKIPNVFFAGEILDVDGITGGFNFQHSWTSGWIAAKSIAGGSREA
jgi:predicted Rossmann fold flavoprotein